jgi:hypothetical protein
MKHALLIVPLLFGACVGGDIGAPNIQQGQPDAPGTQPPDAFVPPIDMDLSAGCVDRVVAALDPGPTHTNGDINLGDPVGCVSSGCHSYTNHANNAPAFIFGGTVYKPGTTDPDPGVTIIITPDNTAIPPIKVTTSAKGTFYVPQLQGSTPEMPASAIATACPKITKGHQSGKIKLGTTPGVGGNCNACHTATGEGGVEPHLNIGL